MNNIKINIIILLFFFSFNTQAQKIKAYNDNGTLKQNEEQVYQIRYQLCRDIYTDNLDFNTERFRLVIAEGIGIDHKKPGSSIHISNFLNKNYNNLICDANPANTLDRNKHIFKDMIFRGFVEIFDDIIMDYDEYSIDWNQYEIVNGKKETLIDYIDFMIKQEGDAEGDLAFLIGDLQDLGAKRGAEL